MQDREFTPYQLRLHAFIQAAHLQGFEKLEQSAREMLRIDLEQSHEPEPDKAKFVRLGLEFMGEGAR
jgi:hypothetical protein